MVDRPIQMSSITAAIPGRMTEYSRGRKYLCRKWSLSTKGWKNDQNNHVNVWCQNYCLRVTWRSSTPKTTKSNTRNGALKGRYKATLWKKIWLVSGQDFFFSPFPQDGNLVQYFFMWMGKANQKKGEGGIGWKWITMLSKATDWCTLV